MLSEIFGYEHRFSNGHFHGSDNCKFCLQKYLYGMILYGSLIKSESVFDMNFLSWNSCKFKS